MKIAGEYEWSSARAHVLGKYDAVLGDSKGLEERMDSNQYLSYVREEASQGELMDI